MLQTIFQCLGRVQGTLVTYLMEKVEFKSAIIRKREEECKKKFNGGKEGCENKLML